MRGLRPHAATLARVLINLPVLSQLNLGNPPSGLGLYVLSGTATNSNSPRPCIVPAVGFGLRTTRVPGIRPTPNRTAFSEIARTNLAWGMPAFILSPVKMGSFSAFRVESDFVRTQKINLGHCLGYGSSGMGWVIAS